MTKLTLLPRLGLLFAVQLALVGVAVAPQVSARVSGEEYLLRVAPVDPIDPFRGAYVDLGYPDLPSDPPEGQQRYEAVYLPLFERNGVWVATEQTTRRPTDAPYLACDARSWRLRCGIESLFLPQDEAAGFAELVASDGAVARVRIDARGHAALVGVEPR